VPNEETRHGVSGTPMSTSVARQPMPARVFRESSPVDSTKSKGAAYRGDLGQLDYCK
jgi:hypothetical protein